MKLYWAAALLLGGSTGALADWTFSRWGMTVEELIAASGGAAKKVKDKKDDRIGNSRRLAVGSFVDGGTKFSTEFYFDDGKLAFLRYAPPEGMGCEDEERVLVGIYGEGNPIEKTERLTFTRNPVLHHSRTRNWAREAGDVMSFDYTRFSRPDIPGVYSRSFCTLVIEPAVRAAQNGDVP